jgi:hypothetical protein
LYLPVDDIALFLSTQQVTTATTTRKLSQNKRS